MESCTFSCRFKLSFCFLVFLHNLQEMIGLLSWLEACHSGTIFVFVVFLLESHLNKKQQLANVNYGSTFKTKTDIVTTVISIEIR